MRTRQVTAKASSIVSNERTPRSNHTLNLLILMILFIPINQTTQIIHFRMEEEKPVGFLIGLLLKHLPDAILTSSGTLMFRTIEQEHAKFFNIGIHDGRIQISQPIDRETVCPYTEEGLRGDATHVDCQVGFTVNLLRITNATTEIVDVLQIYITVDDVDDNSCSFQPSEKQTIYLPEDTPVNTSISLHRPVDLDIGKGNGINGSTVQFIPENISFSPSATNTFALRVLKTDSLIKPFALELVLQSPLDYESKSLYSIQIVITGYDDKECRLSLTVHVTDCNDNPPRFSRNFSIIEVPETSPLNVPIYTVSAFDSDLGPLYSKLIYEIDSFASPIITTTFRIDAQNGSIFLQYPLNFRKQSTYDIPITVHNPVRFEDNSGIPDELTRNIAYRFMDKTHVRVYVTTANNQPPIISVFTPEGGDSISLPEHVSDLPFDFAIVSVTDDDVGLNGNINCSLEQSGSKQFKLTQITPYKQKADVQNFNGEPNSAPVELIYKLSALQSFDREVLTSVPLKIQCINSGSRKLTSEYMVKVQIDDINDHSPQFNKTKWRFTVNEDTDPSRQRIDYMIGQINAIDLDIGRNAYLTYHIVNESNGPHFAVDNKTGVIRSNGNLDRELSDHYQFILVATDAGTPPLSGTTVVDVFVRDYNDETPMFAKQSYTFHIDENNGYGELIGSLHATDMDEGSNAVIEFHLEHMLPPVNRRGTQSTVMSPNSEKLPFDLVSYFDTLHNTYEVRLYANQIIDREAVVPSLLYNRRSSEDHLLTSLKTHLSPSTTTLMPTFKFWVVGEDGGVPRRRGQTVVHVYVDDVNDQAPIFQTPINNATLITVSYLEKTGHNVFQVSATDADAGHNGTVRYFIQAIHLYNQTSIPVNRNDSTPELTFPKDMVEVVENTQRYSRLFTIHESSGVIFLAHKLTEEDLGKLFCVELVASDLGTPISLRSTILLLIRIDDSVPVGNMNNDLASLLGDAHEQFTSPHDGSHLNFYIILSILLVSFLIAVILMSGMCYALQKRRSRVTRNGPVLESNGSVDVPMRSTQLWALSKKVPDSPIGTLTRLPRANSWIAKETSQETATDGTKVALLTSLPSETMVSYNPTTFMHILNVESCPPCQAKDHIRPVQLVCSSGTGVTQFVAAPYMLSKSISSPNEPFILCTTDAQASQAASKLGLLQTTSAGLDIQCQRVPNPNNEHPTEVQHVCIHPKQSKRNSVGSLDQDSGNGDSLDTSTASGQTTANSIWMPTAFPTLPQAHASFAMPLFHVYSPLSCVSEVEPNVTPTPVDN